MATYVVGLLLICAVYFAARHVLRVQRRGGCVGCSDGCSGGSCVKVGNNGCSCGTGGSILKAKKK